MLMIIMMTSMMISKCGFAVLLKRVIMHGNDHDHDEDAEDNYCVHVGGKTNNILSDSKNESPSNPLVSSR